MTFYDKNGAGARTFFEAMGNNGLCDSYTINYDKNSYVDKETYGESNEKENLSTIL